MDGMVKDSKSIQTTRYWTWKIFSVVKVKGGRSGPVLHIVVTTRGLNVNVVYRFECQCGFRDWMSMWATGLNVNVVYGF